jgi:site-specific recombinase XerD
MALRNGQGQRKKYLTLELSSVRNLVEDMCAIVSEFQSAKIGGKYTLHYLMQIYGEVVDLLPKKRKFHCLKHSIATHLLDTGANQGPRSFGHGYSDTAHPTDYPRRRR